MIEDMFLTLVTVSPAGPGIAHIMLQTQAVGYRTTTTARISPPLSESARVSPRLQPLHGLEGRKSSKQNTDID